MAKLVNYTCTLCNYDHELILNDTDTPEEDLEMYCPECDSMGTIVLNNVKNNTHRIYINDKGGL